MAERPEGDWLKDFIFTKPRGIVEWNALEELSKKARVGDGIRTELIHDEEVRRRFRPSIREEFKALGARWGAGISAGLDALGPRGEQVLRVLRELRVAEARDEKGLQLLLKQLSDYAKHWGPEVLGQDWKLFVGMELLGGYLPARPVDEFLGDIEDWSAVVSPIKIDLDEFRLGVRQALATGKDAKGKTMEQWSQEYSWARPGASDGPRPWIEVDGVRRHPRKSKNATAFAISPADVLATLRLKKRQVNKAIQKRELGKVRAVIGGGNDLYTLMSYVGSWLDPWLGSTKWSSLFYDRTGLFKMYAGMAADSKNPDTVKLPLDQSKFDHQILKVMVEIMNQEIRLLIETKAPADVRGDLLLAMDGIDYAMAGGGTWVGKVFVPYLNGVLSGWKWTALYDSLANEAEVFVARRRVVTKLGFDPVFRSCVQGDDADLACTSWAGALGIIKAYNDMNAVINPAKFFVSASRNEYLRQVGEDGKVQGYFWRAVPSLLWRNPISRDPPPGVLRLTEQLTGWVVLINRGGDPVSTLRLMWRDLARGNGLKQSEVQEWAYTSNVLGGGGLGDRLIGLAITSQVRKPQGVRIPEGNRGFDWLQKRWNIDRAVMEEDFLTRVELPKQARFEVTREAGVKAVNEEKLKEAGFDGSGFPSQARLVEELPAWLAGTVIQSRIMAKDWDGISALVAPAHRLYDIQLRGRADRNVWLDWIKGKLDVPVIQVLGAGKLDAAARTKELGKPRLSWALTTSHPTRRKLLAAWYTTVTAVRRSYTTLPASVLD